jgi:asparagine synthase (glutamine-hydrolysing)
MLHRWKYRDVQLYNCWHEDRTAAGNGIEARVPFLDHRMIELVAAVPESLRPTLIWDKQILRRAVADVLPPSVAERPKGLFFHGSGIAHTYRTFVRMLAQDGDALVEEALSGGGARHYLDADGIRGTLRAMEADPSSGHVEFLLRVVNLGLLEQLAKSPQVTHASSVRAPVPVSVPITDWDAQHDEVEARVVRQEPLDVGTVLERAERALVLRDAEETGTWFVALDGALEYVLDESEDPHWIRLLRSFDGQKPLGDLLAAVGADPGEMEPLVREAIAAGVLTPSSQDVTVQVF